MTVTIIVGFYCGMTPSAVLLLLFKLRPLLLWHTAYFKIPWKKQRKSVTENSNSINLVKFAYFGIHIPRQTNFIQKRTDPTSSVSCLCHMYEFDKAYN
jgi:hypothetical protein